MFTKFKLERKYRNRLKRLKSILKKVKPVNFNMFNWKSPDLLKGSCKTVCCALGHACLDKTFNKMGLFIYNKFNLYSKDNYKPSYEGYEGYEAGDFFFFSSVPQEVSRTLTHFLFDPQWYEQEGDKVTTKHVIARIDDILNKNFGKFNALCKINNCEISLKST